MGKKINIGLLGAGRIAGHHIRSIKKIKKFNISAICDLNIEKAEFYAKLHGLKSYKHYDDMLKQEPDLDLIVIMSPSGMHYEQALKILLKYKKNLVIEKPTFMKSKQVKIIFNKAKKIKKKIYCVFQNRNNKCVAKLKKAIEKGELGKIRLVNLLVRWCRPQRYYDLSIWRGTFSHDGGALTNQGIHHIDLLRYLFGEIKYVNARMKTFGANIEVEDSVVGNFEYKNGALGSLEVTTSVRPDDYGATISVIGSKGMARMGGLSVNKLELFSPNPKLCKINSENIPDAYGFGHNKLYKDIMEDMTGGKKFPIDFKDCFKSIQLLNSFYVSDEKKRTIVVDKTHDSKRLGRKNNKISKLYR